MSAYLIVQTRIRDAARVEEYKRLAPAVVERFGGRYLARGGRMEQLEGAWDVPRLVILEFPSMERAKAFYDSPEYAAVKKHREGAADYVMTLVEGL